MIYATIKKIKALKVSAINIVSIILLCICNISFLQSATISGRALDEKTEDPLIGANIYIEINDEVLGGATDIDGFYIIENIPEGIYDIKASYLGYEPYTQVFEIDDIDKEYNVDIKLSPSSIKVN